MKALIFSIGIILVSLMTYQQICNSNVKNEVVETIGFEYWDSWETGQRKCEPLIFNRKKDCEKWLLEMPCGGTFTTIILTKEGEENPIQEITIGAIDCPPIFDITNLPDGKYFVRMLACSLGGRVEFNLNTLN